MRYILFVLFAFPMMLQAQVTAEPVPAKPAPIKLNEVPEEDLHDDFSEPLQHFQINLKQAAKEIKLLQYDNDKEPIKGELSDDGWSIILKNYYKKGRVFAEVIYEDGTQKSFSVGSCFIDPIYEL